MFKNKNKIRTLNIQIKKIPLSVLGILIFIVFFSTFFFQKNQYRDFQYELNSITHESVIAPFTFPILKSEEVLKEERNAMIVKTPFVFVFHENSQSIMKKLDEFQKDLNDLNKLIADSAAFFSKKNSIFADYNIHENTNVALIAGSPKKYDKNFFRLIKKSLENIYDNFIININPASIRSDKIAIQSSGEEFIEYPENVLDLNIARTEIKNQLETSLDHEWAETAFVIANHFLEPNLIFDETTTEKRQTEAIKKVPISQGIVLENEKIVDANTKVTPEIYRKLVSLSRERAKRAELKGGIRKFIPLIGDPVIFLGHFALIGIIISFFVTFLLSYKPEITRDNKLMILMGLLIVFQVVVSFIFKYKFNISEYAIPITISAMMMTILFDPKIGFVGTACISILIGAQIGGDVYFIVISIFVSSFAIYSVRKLRNRSQLFMSIIYILLAYLFAITISELLQFSVWQNISKHYLFATFNGIVAPFLTYGFIGLLEKPFDLTTDLTLLELADFNHPLLKRLSKNAPGTFAHCIQVGNLAEAAADAVGANALLARVGSYYHDVGKVIKPEYFVENQSYISNKHDNLAPNMSALIIINHVKEGLKLAKEYKLPQVVTDFIPSHHGTTRVEYFLNRAQNQAENPEDINEADFGYPGPKPHTKETGIVMLVESIEAACRSIEKPTISNIIKVIDMIISMRLEEGQLDDCPLTFSDLKKIKGNIKENSGILPVLKSIYHLRPEYPEQDKKS
ncbi:MAG: HDIG domain-containing protein [Candidatus Marinimicrobia bacterium]|nr:HDIG domain-containing protein [Candidatus Neomarinimicrobiota bacterium]